MTGSGDKKEQVNEQDVLASLLPPGTSRSSLSTPNLQRLQPLEKAGLQLALGVGLAIALITVLVAGDWFQNRPDMPVLSKIPAGDAQKAIDSFKALNEVALERATKLFDLIVVKAFLPVFTGILGYIFGSRTERAPSEKSE